MRHAATRPPGGEEKEFLLFFRLPLPAPPLTGGDGSDATLPVA